MFAKGVNFSLKAILFNMEWEWGCPMEIPRGAEWAWFSQFGNPISNQTRLAWQWPMNTVLEYMQTSFLQSTEKMANIFSLPRYCQPASFWKGSYSHYPEKKKKTKRKAPWTFMLHSLSQNSSIFNTLKSMIYLLLFYTCIRPTVPST